jgi:DNA-binding winged helix-turn-helix (wHTH) protein/Flp pilus assembly protein TadD
MESPQATARVFRFGVFELDEASGELRKRGVKVRLAEQPQQILRLLLDRPGQIVTRQEIRQQLWDSDTFVDFDVGLNSAIRKLREALDESAENPRFIETLPRRGYRLIAPVQTGGSNEPNVGSGEPLSPSRTPSPWVRASLALGVVVVGTLGVAYERTARVNVAPRPVASTPTDVPAGVNPEAYDAYLKGVLAAGQQTTEGFKTAIQYFQTAIARQPDFAAAHAAMAKFQLQFLYTGPLAPRDVVPKAEAEVRTALKLDNTISAAHTTLGTILQQFYWQWNEGEKEFRRAQALGDSGGNAIILSFIRNGRVHEGIAEAERLVAEDPQSFNAHTGLGTALRAAGQYDRALSHFHRARDIMPQRPRGHFQLGVTLLAMGRVADAITELEASIEWHNPRMEAYLGYAYAIAERREDARTILVRLTSRRQQEYVSSFGIALIQDALDERDQAVAALERACEDHAVEFAQMPQYPPFKSIANEPRYHAVMRRVGLEQ